MCILSQLSGHSLILLIVELQRADLLLQRLEDDEQRGNDEDLQDGTNQHTTNGSSSQSLVTILSYTLSEHHRQQTDDHSQRGHQDRTQTGTGTQNG